VSFLIGRDGSVDHVESGGLDLPDPDVVACVVRGFKTLEFPAPEGAPVRVVFPLQFTPGEDP